LEKRKKQDHIIGIHLCVQKRKHSKEKL